MFGRAEQSTTGPAARRAHRPIAPLAQPENITPPPPQGSLAERTLLRSPTAMMHWFALARFSAHS